jgi:hypothetical protein
MADIMGVAYQKVGVHQTCANFARINWCPHFPILKVGNYAVPIQYSHLIGTVQLLGSLHNFYLSCYLYF